MGWLGLPRLGRVGAKEPADSLGIELVLVPKMTVEPSSRQTGVLHYFVDRDLGESLFVEEAPRAFEDFLVRVALMLRCIGHSFLRCVSAILIPKDDLEHLFR